jgi:hypothetical protein
MSPGRSGGDDGLEVPAIGPGQNVKDLSAQFHSWRAGLGTRPVTMARLIDMTLEGDLGILARDRCKGSP